MARMTREELIAILESDIAIHEGRGDRSAEFCIDGCKQVLALLKGEQTQKRGVINLPEPTPEMLHALRVHDSNVLEYYVPGGNYHYTALVRYNRLKEILARPATKTVTHYVLIWYRVDTKGIGMTHYNTETEAAQARDGLSDRAIHRKIIPIEVTVDDTTD